MYDDDCFYITMPVPEGLSIDSISSLKERIRTISSESSKIIFEASHLDIEKISIEESKLSEEDLFNLSKDDEDDLKMKIGARNLLNDAVNHILIPILSDPSGLMWSPKTKDFAILNIKGDRYIVTGGPKKYSWSNPTKAYGYIMALNIFGIYIEDDS